VSPRYQGALYKYPPEAFRIDPLDTTVDEPQYIIYGCGPITYAWTDRDAEFDVRLEHAIEGGRFNLLWTQKVAVAHDGAVVREWPLVNEPHVAVPPEPGERDPEEAYARRRDHWRRLCGHLVIDEHGEQTELEDRYDYDAVLAALRAASSGGGRALALFVYDGTSWW
jgi:hypothetical protein